MTRRLFNFAVVVLLLLCVGTVALWARSYLVRDDWTIDHAGKPWLAEPSGRSWQPDPSGLWERNALRFLTTSSRGGVFLQCVHRIHTPTDVFIAPTGWSFAHVKAPAESYSDIAQLGDTDLKEPIQFSFKGFTYGRYLDPNDQDDYEYDTIHGAGAPFAFFAAVLLILPGTKLITILRDQRAKRRNNCPKCGSDVRAAPGRCPECGTKIQLRHIADPRFAFLRKGTRTRRLSITSIASLLAFGLVAGAGARSFWTWEGWWSEHGWGLGLEGGCACYSRGSGTANQDIAPGHESGDFRQEDFDYPGSKLGFWVGTTSTSGTGQLFLLRFPLWFPLLPLLVAPVRWLMARTTGGSAFPVVTDDSCPRIKGT